MFKNPTIFHYRHVLFSSHPKGGVHITWTEAKKPSRERGNISHQTGKGKNPRLKSAFFPGDMSVPWRVVVLVISLVFISESEPSIRVKVSFLWGIRMISHSSRAL